MMTPLRYNLPVKLNSHATAHGSGNPARDLHKNTHARGPHLFFEEGINGLFIAA
jgi:hypothetical protein